MTHDDRLDDALARYLGGSASRSTLLHENPDLAADLREFFADQDRMDRMAAPLRAAIPKSWPDRIGPYEILGELGRGGMGVVLHARHPTLNRDAALKLLLAGKLASVEEVARLRREASFAASLDHPNILPLWEIGEHEGMPYLAMPRMDGSLADLPKPIPTHRIASLVAQIARGVHHAHERGLLHRDLKPANILLDDRTHGTPKIADFGLARRVDGPASTAAIAGTPAYMSPEQASGKPGAVTTASDIYGLGAILYELLAGRPPFKGDSAVAVLRQVVESEPVWPSGLDPGLSAIARKCLEKEPARRYATAAELADDLERWLAGEPIKARPPGAASLALRWVRKRPAIASLSLALLVAVVLGASLVLHYWHQDATSREQAENALAALQKAKGETDRALVAERKAKGEAQRALAAERRAKEEADEHFRQAHDVVNEFLTGLHDELAQMPGAQQLQRRALRRARAYLESFIRTRGGTPALREELADTHANLARLTGATGDRRSAAESCRAALSLYRELHEAAPASLPLRRKLVGALANLALYQDAAAAIATQEEALALYRRFLAEAPDDTALEAALALVLGNKGSSLMRAGQLDEGRAALEECIALQRRLVERLPTSLGLRRELALSVSNLGVLLSRQDDRPAALCVHLHAAQLRRAIVAAAPADAQARSALAAAYQHAGLAFQHLGMREEGDEALAAALEARRLVASANPLVVRYQADLAASLTSQGVARNRDKRGSGLASFVQARDILQRLAEQDESDLLVKHQLGEAWFNIGATHGALGRREEEGDAFEAALPIQQALVDADAQNAEHRHALARTLNNLGLNYWVRKREKEAVPLLERAVAITSKLLAASPTSREYRSLLNAHHGLLAACHWNLGDAKASADEVAKRLALWPRDGEQQWKGARELARLLPGCPEEMRAKIEAAALAALRRSVQSGYATAARLADPGLAPLRSHPDFPTPG